MGNLSEFVRAHLERNVKSAGWQPMDETRDRLTVGCSGKNTGMVGCIEVKEDKRMIRIGVSNGVRAPRERMRAAYEMVCRFNIGLAIGQFWIDSDDGEITFSVTASLLEIEPSDMWLGSLVSTAFATYDVSFPVIADVLYGSREPAVAIAAQEGPSDDEVADSVQRLFSATGDEDEEGEAKPESVTLELPHPVDPDPEPDGRGRHRVLHDIIARLTPGEVAEILQDERRRRQERAESGGPDEAE